MPNKAPLIVINFVKISLIKINLLIAIPDINMLLIELELIRIDSFKQSM